MVRIISTPIIKSTSKRVSQSASSSSSSSMSTSQPDGSVDNKKARPSSSVAEPMPSTSWAAAVAAAAAAPPPPPPAVAGPVTPAARTKKPRILPRANAENLIEDCYLVLFRRFSVQELFVLRRVCHNWHLYATKTCQSKSGSLTISLKAEPYVLTSVHPNAFKLYFAEDQYTYLTKERDATEKDAITIRVVTDDVASGLAATLTKLSALTIRFHSVFSVDNLDSLNKLIRTFSNVQSLTVQILNGRKVRPHQTIPPIEEKEFHSWRVNFFRPLLNNIVASNMKALTSLRIEYEYRWGMCHRKYGVNNEDMYWEVGDMSPVLSRLHTLHLDCYIGNQIDVLRQCGPGLTKLTLYRYMDLNIDGLRQLLVESKHPMATSVTHLRLAGFNLERDYDPLRCLLLDNDLIRFILRHFVSVTTLEVDAPTMKDINGGLTFSTNAMTLYQWSQLLHEVPNKITDFRLFNSEVVELKDGQQEIVLPAITKLTLCNRRSKPFDYYRNERFNAYMYVKTLARQYPNLKRLTVVTTGDEDGTIQPRVESMIGKQMGYLEEHFLDFECPEMANYVPPPPPKPKEEEDPPGSVSRYKRMRLAPHLPTQYWK